MLDSTLVTLSLVQRAQTTFWLQKTNNKGNITEGEKERVKVDLFLYNDLVFEQLSMKSETGC